MSGHRTVITVDHERVGEQFTGGGRGQVEYVATIKVETKGNSLASFAPCGVTEGQVREIARGCVRWFADEPGEWVPRLESIKPLDAALKDRATDRASQWRVRIVERTTAGEGS